MGELTIQEQNNAKYLGVHIDRALKWNLQIENVIKKLASAARILRKIRHYVDRQTLINLYYTFAYPHLKYGVLAWGNADKALMQKITVMQNGIIRIINFKLLKDHVKMSVLYKAMNILQAPDMFKLEVGKFMHSFHHQTLPESFQSCFTPTNTSHKYVTRSVTNKHYFIKRVNTQCGQSACTYIGAKIWNDISQNLKLMSKYRFTKEFEKQIIAKYCLNDVTVSTHQMMSRFFCLLTLLFAHCYFFECFIFLRHGQLDFDNHAMVFRCPVCCCMVAKLLSYLLVFH